jgi:hypothetical protein
MAQVEVTPGASLLAAAGSLIWITAVGLLKVVAVVSICTMNSVKP